MKRIYLDYAAATPLDKRVKKAMDGALEFFGNPSSIHEEGRKAKEVVEESRKKIASVLGCKAGEIIFTSGGTESNNLAIFGLAQYIKNQGKVGHIITSKIEHPSVLEPIKTLEHWGFSVTYLGSGDDGIIKIEDVKKAIREDTILVSTMYANNEIGTIQPIREISKIIRSYKPYAISHMPFFHSDACQASEYLNLKVETLGVDLMTINSSKVYGPKGVGILYKKSGVKIFPQILGGGQEWGFRSGTESVSLIAGFAKALKIAEEQKKEENWKVSSLRDYFIDKVLEEIPGSALNGSKGRRLPNNANFNFLNIGSESVIIKLDAKGIACSSGSACASQYPKEGESKNSVRFSLGRQTNKKELDYVVKVLKDIIS